MDSRIENNEILATVDIGSNSFRLLVAKQRRNGSLLPIDQIKETVRLAAGLDQDNNLTIESQKMALAVLSRFAERLVGFAAHQVRVVGTSTLRVAKNADDFIVLANKALGFKVEVISGVEEARLIYIGAMHSLSYTQDKRLVVDIGGGSTEFIIGSGYDPEVMESVTMGCVSFSQRYFVDGDLTEQHFANAVFAARGKIQAMEHLFAKRDWAMAIGTSGSARALYDLCVSYVGSDMITLDGLYKIEKALIKAKNIKHIDLNGLKEDRSPVIAGGLAIMIAIFEEFDIECMTIADGSLREGVMYDLLGRKSNQDLREVTVKSLKEICFIDEAQSFRVSSLTVALYLDLLGGTIPDSNQVKLLQWAGELYEVGLGISHNDYHKHGAYILANADLGGFSKPEQTVLADLVRSHRGGLSKVIESLKGKKKAREKLLLMVLAFRISVILNRNRKNCAAIVSLKQILGAEIELGINAGWLENNPLTLYSLNEEIEQWKKAGFMIKLVAVN